MALPHGEIKIENLQKIVVGNQQLTINHQFCFSFLREFYPIKIFHQYRNECGCLHHH